jgi:exopolyphosphatase/guanosine-5'-triphosphate,3'-diphosphate pyrophosphatase
MGTNTFHLLIAEVENGAFDVIHKEKIAVRLGAGGINMGLINPEAMDRALTALVLFKSQIDSYEIHDIYATATSAIRNAENGNELVRMIKQKTGIKTKIISGQEEASYIYKGVINALNISSCTNLIMDIGGGSIELILADSNGLLWKQSFEIGAQRMIEKFHLHDPILPNEIAALNVYLDSNLKELHTACQQFKPDVLIGSSGTFDTLSDIHQKKERYSISKNATELPYSLNAFNEIYKDLVSKNREERLAIDGMIPLRVDMIVVASVLIKYIIESLEIKNIRISAYALKEGLLMEKIEEINNVNVPGTVN